MPRDKDLQAPHGGPIGHTPSAIPPSYLHCNSPHDDSLLSSVTSAPSQDLTTADKSPNPSLATTGIG
jgi:hypothetical protein